MTPEFFYRPRFYDHLFLAGYPARGRFDAALLRGEYIAPHPPGSPSAIRGWSGRKPIEEGCSRSRAGFVVDPRGQGLGGASKR